MILQCSAQILADWRAAAPLNIQLRFCETADRSVVDVFEQQNRTQRTLGCGSQVLDKRLGRAGRRRIRSTLRGNRAWQCRSAEIGLAGAIRGTTERRFATAEVRHRPRRGPRLAGHSFPDIRPMDFERHSNSEFASKDGSLNASSGWRPLMACEASCRLGKDACFEIMPEMLNPVGFVADGVFPSNLGR
jgi:hypothetical protein